MLGLFVSLTCVVALPFVLLGCKWAYRVAPYWIEIRGRMQTARGILLCSPGGGAPPSRTRLPHVEVVQPAADEGPICACVCVVLGLSVDTCILNLSWGVAKDSASQVCARNLGRRRVTALEL